MKTPKLYTPKTGVGRLAGDMLRRYYVHDVARDSAALTYYLLFALFPLLIFVSALLGILELDIDSITAVLTPLLPVDVVGVVRSYLTYVAANQSRQLLWFSLIFSIWFPMRSTGCLMHSLRKAFGRSAPENMLLTQLRNLLFTVWMILVIGDAGAGGGRPPCAALPVPHRPLSETFISVWGYLRFIILGLVMAISLGILYQLALGPAPPPAGGTARRGQLAGGVAAAEHGLFLLCGKRGPICAALRLHRHCHRGTAVAVYVGPDPDFGRGAVLRPDTP